MKQQYEDLDNSYKQEIRLVDTLLDRPIVVHRCFIAITGSLEAAVFLSQAKYWTNTKIKLGEDGWFYKTQEDWQEETGLGRHAQERSRKILMSLGILEERKEGLPARLYYRICFKQLYDKLTSLTPPFQQNANSGKLVCPPSTDKCDPSRQTSPSPADRLYKEAEITAEITTEITKEACESLFVDSGFPEGVTHELWAEYKKMRQCNHCRLTEYAERMELKNLWKLYHEGQNPVEVINQSIAKSYRGLFAVVARRNGNGNGRRKSGYEAIKESERGGGNPHRLTIVDL